MVSVIIPVYNTEEYVGRCVESVMAQTYADIEIILIDDGSDDASLSICQSLQCRDNRITLVSQDNRGASMARNRGLDITKGEYIMFVDSDDWIEPEMTQSLVSLMEKTSVDIVVSPLCDDCVPYPQETIIDNETALLRVLRDRHWWGPYGKLYSRSAIGDLRFPKPTISEDYWFNTHLLLGCNYLYYTPKSYYHRTVRKNGLSNLGLCKRKFEEIENVMSVNETIRIQKPQFEKYTERNLAETLLKLLTSIKASPNAVDYDIERDRIRSLMHGLMLKVLRNGSMTLGQRLFFVMSGI